MNYNIPITNGSIIPGSETEITTVVQILETNILMNENLRLSNNTFSQLPNPTQNDYISNKIYIDQTPYLDPSLETIETTPYKSVLLTTIAGWVSVAWAADIVPSVFVVISSQGSPNPTDPPLIAISYDGGFSWTNTLGYTSALWASVIWAPIINKFVSIPMMDSYMMFPLNIFQVSDDAVTWVSVQAPAQAVWSSIAWAGLGASTNIFVACALMDFYGDVGYFGVSYNALNWATVAATTKARWSSIVWGGSSILSGVPGPKKFVAVNIENNVVNISSNGITWTSASIWGSPSTIIGWKYVTWGGNNATGISFPVYIAIQAPNQSSIMAVSYDGITWTSASFTTMGNWSTISWSPQIESFIAVSRNTDTNGMTDVINVSNDGLTWFGFASMTTLAYWNSSIWAPELNKFMVVGAPINTNLIDSYPSSIKYKPNQIINTIIDRISYIPVTDFFPTAQDIYNVLYDSIGASLAVGYSFNTQFNNISTNQLAIVTLQFSNTGIESGNGCSLFPVLQKGSSIYITYILKQISPPIFSVYYIPTINFLDITTSPNKDMYRFGSGLKISKTSLWTQVIYNNTSTSSVIYTKNNLLSGIITRNPSIPIGDYLPPTSELLYNGIFDGDCYRFILKNIGSALLTVYLNGIGIDYNNPQGIFIELPALHSSTCILIYNGITKTFFAYELYRGTL